MTVPDQRIAVSRIIVGIAALALLNALLLSAAPRVWIVVLFALPLGALY